MPEKLRLLTDVYPIRIPPELAEALYDLAYRGHESQNDVITRLLQEGVERHKEE